MSGTLTETRTFNVGDLVAVRHYDYASRGPGSPKKTVILGIVTSVKPQDPTCVWNKTCQIDYVGPEGATGWTWSDLVDIVQSSSSK